VSADREKGAAVIRVERLRKEYGDLVAVKDFSFEAEPGRIFGLLGPNGAGKSTIIGCISGLLKPTSGTARILDHDIVREPLAAKRQLGVVPQDLALYEDLSAEQNLDFWGGAYGLAGATLKRRVDELLELIGLQDRAKEAVKKYSGGMKRRLNFACGIVHEPKVLLLDEPTVGVDPQSRVRLLDLVREQAAAGTCVLYTTHYMEEAETLCDRLAIVDHGNLIASGSLDELQAMLGERDLLRLSGSFPDGAVSLALNEIDDLEIVLTTEDMVTLAMKGASRMLPAIFSALEKTGASIQETTVTRPSLETLFIKLTGKELRE
jgi:ABC-2 type transport system ATP-binding protein